MLTCRVLGATEVEAGTRRVPLGGPLPRRLITALIAADGRPVSEDALADTIWGAEQPASPTVSMQSYVSRLRSALGPFRDALERVGDGYRLRAVADTATFVAHVERGRMLLAAHPYEAARAFEAALRLWRGPPYADLTAAPSVAPARARLEELRAVAVEERLAARLALGDAPGAVPDLQSSVRGEPYRERRWELLILGLYRSGRQADALAALRRVRALLADDLAIDPGPGLQALERRLLAQDPRLLVPDRPARRTENGPVVGRPAPISRPLSVFLGRRAELATLDQLLAEHRLITLVGPGGAGKTRLAVEHAAGRADPDGPWLVRLSDLSDPGLLAAAVAAETGVLAPADGLATALADRTGVLVLDNCEHLVAEVADLVLRLLAGCPGLRVLATSRELLGVDGERSLPVAPLAPEPAVALLVDRIGAIRPGWVPTDDEMVQLGQLAAALDGIPLALELAAARARVLGLRELADNLDDRFAVLGRVPRGALAPHATLEAAIAWSVDLLSPADRALLLRLWPFEGGFPLEAAVAVGSDLESLSSLVARSVVVADTTVSPTRYRLLGLLRAYCRGRDPEPAASRAAHAAWVRALVERAERDLHGERSARAIRLLNREVPNLRAAISHDLVVAPAAALRTAGLLDWFWYRGGHVEEGQRVLGAALAAAPHAPAVDRARAWASCGALRFIAGDAPAAAAALDEVHVALGEPVEAEGRALLGQIRYYEALMWLSVGDFATARVRAEESVRLGRAVGEPWIVEGGEISRGGALIGLGAVEEGRAVLAAAVDLSDRIGQQWAAAMGERLLARSYLDQSGGAEPAAATPDPSQPVQRRVGVAAHLNQLDTAKPAAATQPHLDQPDSAEQATTLPHPDQPDNAEPAAALRYLLRALRRFVGEDDAGNVLTCLLAGAWALALAGRPADAAAVRSGVRRRAARRGLRPEATDPAGTAALTAALAKALSADELAAAERRGEALDEEAMIAVLAAARVGELVAGQD